MKIYMIDETGFFGGIAAWVVETLRLIIKEK